MIQGNLNPDRPARLAGELRAHMLGSFERFCGGLYIVPKNVAQLGGKGRVPFKLNSIQKAFNVARTGRDVVVKARQVGFTTLEQARDVYHMLTVPQSRVVAVCQSMTGHTAVRTLSRNYRMFFASLSSLGFDLEFSSQSVDAWELESNGSSLTILQAGASEAAAAKKGRTGTITRLHLTETAYYEYAEETLNALEKCVPVPETGSEIVSESTPHGAAGVFYEQWQGAVNGTTGFKAHFFPWHMQEEYRTELGPGEVVEESADPVRSIKERLLTPEQVKWWRREKANEKSPGLTEQEFPDDPDTCFLMSGRGFFYAPRVAQCLALARGVAPATKTVRSRSADATIRAWHAAEPGRSYVLALDTAEGRSSSGKDPDRSAGIVLDRGDGKHVATIWGKLAPEQLAQAAVHVARAYNDAEIVVERNNHGHACLLALGAGYSAIGEYGPWPHVFRDRDGKLGWLTTEPTRTTALDNLEIAFRRAAFSTLDVELAREMKDFVVDDRGRAEASKGAHDDLVMSAAIAWDVACRRRTRRDLTDLPSA